MSEKLYYEYLYGNDNERQEADIAFVSALLDAIGEADTRKVLDAYAEGREV